MIKIPINQQTYELFIRLFGLPSNKLGIGFKDDIKSILENYEGKEIVS